MDGVDGVLLDFSGGSPRVTYSASVAMPDTLKAELMALNRVGHNELHRAALAANGLVCLYSDVMKDLLAQSNYVAKDIVAVGVHGQTVRHRPDAGYTLQLNNPALLAEMVGIDVVAAFRSRCVAAGGQGAPLAPFFHQAVFADPADWRAILNIGGISNLTVLPPLGDSTGGLLGFDCGPGNALLDYWCSRHQGQPFDKEGCWAATGQVHPGLLDRWLSAPYFVQPPPKSTGRDLFNPDWLIAHLKSIGLEDLPAQDVQATLSELTAQSCAQAVQNFAPRTKELLVCGGGAYNTHIMRNLQRLLPSCGVMSSGERGVPPMQVEAAAFAWLARKTVRREVLPLKSTTGAKGSRILGCIYPA